MIDFFFINYKIGRYSLPAAIIFTNLNKPMVIADSSPGKILVGETCSGRNVINYEDLDRRGQVNKNLLEQTASN